jgi:hypothetical protein
MTYCFDLDGTLCSHEQNYSNAKPLNNRIEILNKLYNEGHRIIIDTARGSETGINWLDTTKRQLEEWGVKYHELRVGRKISADIYIDDKGINDKNFFENEN